MYVRVWFSDLLILFKPKMQCEIQITFGRRELNELTRGKQRICQSENENLFEVECLLASCQRDKFNVDSGKVIKFLLIPRRSITSKQLLDRVRQYFQYYQFFNLDWVRAKMKKIDILAFISNLWISSVMRFAWCL